MDRMTGQHYAARLFISISLLTVNCHTARFIARYGSPAYYRHSNELMFYQRQTEIIRRLEELETGLLSEAD